MRLIGAALMAGLAGAVVLLIAIPVADEPVDLLNLRADHAQLVVDQLRHSLHVTSEVRVVIVKSHPLVFSVEPTDRQRQSFRLAMESGFLILLDEEELLGALAHEMGHVWIYQHHPYLQTERLANEIAQTIAPRIALEKVYRKLWIYEGTGGVPFNDLLGPPAVAASEGVQE